MASVPIETFKKRDLVEEPPWMGLRHVSIGTLAMQTGFVAVTNDDPQEDHPSTVYFDYCADPSAQ